MKPFSADWLQLREPYDRQARNAVIIDQLVSAVSGLRPISIVDLGCGTGSTFRALAPRLAMPQHWLLVDNDLGLLQRAAALNARTGARITTRAIDLVRDLEAALDGAIDLVTASALLDLVSAEWLDRFVVECAARRLPAYLALTHDEIAVEPADAADAEIIAAVYRHQQNDKGFGPALGPRAAKTAIASFQRAGYGVDSRRSDWELEARKDDEMQDAVLHAWASAARDERSVPLGEIAAWLTRRRDLLAAGRSALRIGHVDLLALPAAS
jgi:SAM-dependent methyltransferase